MRRLFAITLTIGILLWAAALFAAPARLSEHSLPAALFYDAAGLVCHQRPERSFSMNGVQMPVCARCLGLYLAGAAGAVLGWIGLAGGVPSSAARRVLVSTAVPTALTVAVESLGLFQPSGLVRAAAAVPLGIAVGWLLVRTVRCDAAPVRARQMRYHA